ncbi:hypothetical protein [Clostridium sp.]|uniref:hypothetical protein n=1 Tax=Clostridium sp. TaxID=1506 RepID=UPI002902E8A7|nr:hypothetical protein [Clostridium sp.]MDU7259495.1 hypothetical protein [Clostridium butyricum]MDU1069904.1 hypothetical protein [Clostridium sp.]MDU2677790.1 hypothetical protein [Clostridium sp.]MDU4213816.1 hypothetical protein [Clostridium sp.]MDU5173776.1 hypothetical protein [Clostridium sp.]
MNKLKAKQIIKNYKELCKVMGWKEYRNGSNSYNAQMKELEKLCKYHKEGHRFFIDEVYQEKQVELSSGKYMNDIQTLLLHILSTKEDGLVETTIKNLMSLLDIVNDNYINGYFDKSKIGDKLKVEEEYINEVYGILNSYKRTIDNSLKALERKRLISLSINKKICYDSPVYKRNDDGSLFKDINGDYVVVDYEKDFRIPSIEEERLVLAIEEEEMKKLGVKDILYFNINQEVGSIWRINVSKRLKEYKINYMFDCYRIVYNHESIERKLKRTEEKEIRDRLNCNILEQVIKTINNYHEKNILNEDVQELINMGLYTIEEIKNMCKFDELKNNEDYIFKCVKVAKRIIDRHVRSRDIIK